MHRQSLLNLLQSYTPTSDYERQTCDAIRAFVREHHDCFLRESLVGHITGSAWVVNKTMTKTLLTHHRKLDKWLQLGGHCDGDSDVLRVALREAVEESGVYDIIPHSPEIFDLDIHEIPERRTGTVVEPAHLHYDIRFLLIADDTAPLGITAESKDLQWVELRNVQLLTQEESMLRMVEKTRLTKHHG
jgi:8-oxo-dGTP pyrophosphatase MutT (NUDIX family)